MASKALLMTAVVAAILMASSVQATGSGLPGDVARPGDNGVPWPNPQPTPGLPSLRPPPPPAVPAPPVELALQAAQAIAQACKQYPLGVAVVNSEGNPILVYIPDGSEAHHTYTAIRKAYTTVKFKVPTSDLRIRANQDPQFAAVVKADPNLIAFKGGIPLKVGNDIIGAIGVSGAEPGGHDEECGMIGVARIKDSLRAEANSLKLTPHHATISVADLDRESQWYASVLGFEKSNVFDGPDTRGCSMVIPSYSVDLIQQKGSSKRDTQIGPLRQGWLHVVFRTPMIEEALKRLEAAGTDVKAFKYDGVHLQRLILHDPEGNEVELHI